MRPVTIGESAITFKAPIVFGFHRIFSIFTQLYCSIGAGEASDILNTRTKGSKPIMPENSKLIDPSSNTVTLHLPTWKDGGCRMSHFVVEYKKKYEYCCSRPKGVFIMCKYPLLGTTSTGTRCRTT